MKKSSLCLFFCIAGLSLNSQTILYAAQADGSIDKNSYRQVLQKSGLLIFHDQSTAFKNDTVHNFILTVQGNEVHCDWRDNGTKTQKGIDGLLGVLEADGRISDWSPTVNFPAKPAPYIKDKIIYGPDNKVMGYIEGEDLYGAALYLMHD